MVQWFDGCLLQPEYQLRSVIADPIDSSSLWNGALALNCFGHAVAIDTRDKGSEKMEEKLGGIFLFNPIFHQYLKGLSMLACKSEQAFTEAEFMVRCSSCNALVWHTEVREHSCAAERSENAAAASTSQHIQPISTCQLIETFVVESVDELAPQLPIDRRLTFKINYNV